MKENILRFLFLICFLVGLVFIYKGSEVPEVEYVSKTQGVVSSPINYHNDGIEGSYPNIISGGSREDMDAWNLIIQQDFKKILDIYAFRPFLTEEQKEKGNAVLLRIQYEIKSQGERFFSVLYRAAYNSTFSAHPTEMVYTTNIDLKNNKRLALKDLVGVDENFVKNFRTWKFIPVESENQELMEAIQTTIQGMSDADILQGFETADIIGSGNLWGIYSYIIPGGIGISISVPNFLGDHVEFEHQMSLRVSNNLSYFK